MQQIYRTPMPKCDFNKAAKHRTSAWMFSCKFAAYFQNIFFEKPLWEVASELIFEIWEVYVHTENSTFTANHTVYLSINR